MTEDNPETREHFRKNIWSDFNYGARRQLTQKDIDVMNDLERRLIIARTALKFILFVRPESQPEMDLDQARVIANNALKQTNPQL